MPAPYIKDGELKRVYLLQKNGNKCQLCNIQMVKATTPAPIPDNAMTLDHIIPVSFGGNDEVENLQLICHKCNFKKGSKLPNAMIDKNINDQIKQIKKKKTKTKKGWTFSITFKLSR